MKKLIPLFFLLLIGSTGIAESMNVWVTASCPDYNHVGYEWKHEYYIDNGLLQSPISVTPGQVLLLRSVITEQDKYPDIGVAETTVVFSKESIRYGFATTQSITVTENGGRYSGSSCIWTVEWKFTPDDVLIIPGDVIEDEAFSSVAAKRIETSAGYIGHNAFSDCPNLETAIVEVDAVVEDDAFPETVEVVRR